MATMERPRKSKQATKPDIKPEKACDAIPEFDSANLMTGEQLEQALKSTYSSQPIAKEPPKLSMQETLLRSQVIQREDEIRKDMSEAYSFTGKSTNIEEGSREFILPPELDVQPQKESLVDDVQEKEANQEGKDRTAEMETSAKEKTFEEERLYPSVMEKEAEQIAAVSKQAMKDAIYQPKEYVNLQEIQEAKDRSEFQNRQQQLESYEFYELVLTYRSKLLSKVDPEETFSKIEAEMQELEKQLWSVETKSHNPEYIDAVGQKKTFTIQYEIAKLDSKKFNRLQELLSERRAELSSTKLAAAYDRNLSTMNIENYIGRRVQAVYGFHGVVYFDPVTVHSKQELEEEFYRMLDVLFYFEQDATIEIGKQPSSSNVGTPAAEETTQNGEGDQGGKASSSSELARALRQQQEADVPALTEFRESVRKWIRIVASHLLTMNSFTASNGDISDAKLRDYRFIIHHLTHCGGCGDWASDLLHIPYPGNSGPDPKRPWTWKECDFFVATLDTLFTPASASEVRQWRWEWKQQIAGMEQQDSRLQKAVSQRMSVLSSHKLDRELLLSEGDYVALMEQLPFRSFFENTFLAKSIELEKMIETQEPRLTKESADAAASMMALSRHLLTKLAMCFQNLDKYQRLALVVAKAAVSLVQSVAQMMKSWNQILLLEDFGESSEYPRYLNKDAVQVIVTNLNNEFGELYLSAVELLLCPRRNKHPDLAYTGSQGLWNYLEMLPYGTANAPFEWRAFMKLISSGWATLRYDRKQTLATEANLRLEDGIDPCLWDPPETFGEFREYCLAPRGSLILKSLAGLLRESAMSSATDFAGSGYFFPPALAMMGSKACGIVSEAAMYVLLYCGYLDAQSNEYYYKSVKEPIILLLESSRMATMVLASTLMSDDNLKLIGSSARIFVQGSDLRNARLWSSTFAEGGRLFVSLVENLTLDPSNELLMFSATVLSRLPYDDLPPEVSFVAAMGLTYVSVGRHLVVKGKDHKTWAPEKMGERIPLHASKSEVSNDLDALILVATQRLNMSFVQVPPFELDSVSKSFVWKQMETWDFEHFGDIEVLKDRCLKSLNAVVAESYAFEGKSFPVQAEVGVGSYFCISLTDIGCKPDLLKDDAIGKRLLAYVMSGLEKEMAGKSRDSASEIAPLIPVLIRRLLRRVLEVSGLPNPKLGTEEDLPLFFPVWRYLRDHTGFITRAGSLTAVGKKVLENLRRRTPLHQELTLQKSSSRSFSLEEESATGLVTHLSVRISDSLVAELRDIRDVHKKRDFAMAVLFDIERSWPTWFLFPSLSYIYDRIARTIDHTGEKVVARLNDALSHLRSYLIANDKKSEAEKAKSTLGKAWDLASSFVSKVASKAQETAKSDWGPHNGSLLIPANNKYMHHDRSLLSIAEDAPWFVFLALAEETRVQAERIVTNELIPAGVNTAAYSRAKKVYLLPLLGRWMNLVALSKADSPLLPLFVQAMLSIIVINDSQKLPTLQKKIDQKAKDLLNEVMKKLEEASNHWKVRASLDTEGQSYHKKLESFFAMTGRWIKERKKLASSFTNKNGEEKLLCSSLFDNNPFFGKITISNNATTTIQTAATQDEMIRNFWMKFVPVDFFFSAFYDPYRNDYNTRMTEREAFVRKVWEWTMNPVELPTLQLDFHQYDSLKKPTDPPSLNQLFDKHFEQLRAVAKEHWDLMTNLFAVDNKYLQTLREQYQSLERIVDPRQLSLNPPAHPTKQIVVKVHHSKPKPGIDEILEKLRSESKIARESVTASIPICRLLVNMRRIIHSLAADAKEGTMLPALYYDLTEWTFQLIGMEEHICGDNHYPPPPDARSRRLRPVLDVFRYSVFTLCDVFVKGRKELLPRLLEAMLDRAQKPGGRELLPVLAPMYRPHLQPEDFLLAVERLTAQHLNHGPSALHAFQSIFNGIAYDQAAELSAFVPLFFTFRFDAFPFGRPVTYGDEGLTVGGVHVASTASIPPSLEQCFELYKALSRFTTWAYAAYRNNFKARGNRELFRRGPWGTLAFEETRSQGNAGGEGCAPAYIIAFEQLLDYAVDSMFFVAQRICTSHLIAITETAVSGVIGDVLPPIVLARIGGAILQRTASDEGGLGASMRFEHFQVICRMVGELLWGLRKHGSRGTEPAAQAQPPAQGPQPSSQAPGRDAPPATTARHTGSKNLFDDTTLGMYHSSFAVLINALFQLGKRLYRESILSGASRELGQIRGTDILMALWDVFSPFLVSLPANILMRADGIPQYLDHNEVPKLIGSGENAKRSLSVSSAWNEAANSRAKAMMDLFNGIAKQLYEIDSQVIHSLWFLYVAHFQQLNTGAPIPIFDHCLQIVQTSLDSFPWDGWLVNNDICHQLITLVEKAAEMRRRLPIAFVIRLLGRIDWMESASAALNAGETVYMARILHLWIIACFHADHPLPQSVQKTIEEQLPQLPWTYIQLSDLAGVIKRMPMVVQCQNITMGVNHCFSILKILHQAAGLCKPASESLFSIKPVFVYVTELLSVHAQPPRANANGEIPQATSLPTGWAHPLILKEFVSHLRAAADRSPYNEETATSINKVVDTIARITLRCPGAIQHDIVAALSETILANDHRFLGPLLGALTSTLPQHVLPQIAVILKDYFREIIGYANQGKPGMLALEPIVNSLLLAGENLSMLEKSSGKEEMATVVLTCFFRRAVISPNFLDEEYIVPHFIERIVPTIGTTKDSHCYFLFAMAKVAEVCIIRTYCRDVADTSRAGREAFVREGHPLPVQQKMNLNLVHSYMELCRSFQRFGESKSIAKSFLASLGFMAKELPLPAKMAVRFIFNFLIVVGHDSAQGPWEATKKSEKDWKKSLPASSADCISYLENLTRDKKYVSCVQVIHAALEFLKKLRSVIAEGQATGENCGGEVLRIFHGFIRTVVLGAVRDIEVEKPSAKAVNLLEHYPNDLPFVVYRIEMK